MGAITFPKIERAIHEENTDKKRISVKGSNDHMWAQVDLVGLAIDQLKVAWFPSLAYFSKTSTL